MKQSRLTHHVAIKLSEAIVGASHVAGATHSEVWASQCKSMKHSWNIYWDVEWTNSAYNTLQRDANGNLPFQMNRCSTYQNLKPFPVKSRGRKFWKKTIKIQTPSKYSITQNYASEVENLMFLHEGRHTYFANISEPLSFQNSCAKSRYPPGIAFATRLLLQELPSSLPWGWS